MNPQWPKKTVALLVGFIVLLAVWATVTGIVAADGPGAYRYLSIRHQWVNIWGKGLYKHMSAEVAPQGIAQDFVTLLVALPVLIFSLYKAYGGSIKGRYLLGGTLGYFLVTYLFYTVMGMYNQLFLVYVGLMGASFYAFLITLFSLHTRPAHSVFSSATPRKTTGGFLLFNAVAIAVLWLGIVVPPLVNGSIVPLQVAHYTTLIVQGLDLGILLPAAFICGVLWIQQKPLGNLLTPVYFIFLSILMTALTAKVAAMAFLGYPVIPVIFIIPAFNLVTLVCTVVILKHMNEPASIRKKISHEKKIFA